MSGDNRKSNYHMTDIHCHLLYGVDDGADKIELSIEMLRDAKAQGIDRIILTPHYRLGMFEYDLYKVESAYNSLIKTADEIGVMLNLGCEYHADGDMIDNLKDKRVHTMADTEYVLVEYKYQSSYNTIRGTVNELLANGYVPIIAHAERYEIFVNKPELLKEFRNMGALIQINAGSIVGEEGFKTKQLCKKIIKNHLVDIVASDSHNMTDRSCHMKKACEYVAKKYGIERAIKLFESKPAGILGNE